MCLYFQTYEASGMNHLLQHFDLHGLEYHTVSNVLSKILSGFFSVLHFTNSEHISPLVHELLHF